MQILEYLVIVIGAVNPEYYQYGEEDGFKHLRYVLYSYNVIGLFGWKLGFLYLLGFDYLDRARIHWQS